jgi:hypothetical protein
MRRVTFASAMRSGVGSHAYSAIGAVSDAPAQRATHRWMITIHRWEEDGRKGGA